MKFIVNSEELGRIIQGLSKTVNAKSNLAILDHFLFEVNGSLLNVTASDGENMIRVTVNLAGYSLMNEDREKHFCIHSSMIGDFLKNIPTQPITFDVNMDNFEVKISYQNGHIKFPCTAGTEYPVFNFIKDDYQSVILMSDILLNDLNRTFPFIGQEILRPVMNTICFNFDHRFDVVSTTGNVLVRISHPDIETNFNNKFLLPSKPAALLKYFLEKNKEVIVKFTSNGAAFECENWILTCRLIDGKYPNYNSVIPVNDTLEVILNKKSLQEAIRRMLPMGNQNMKTINLEFFPNLMSISCEDLDFNTSAKETISCETNGDTLMIGVNGEILYDLLSQVNADIVKMKLLDSAKPIVIVPEIDFEGEQFVSLIMPTLMT